MKERLVGHLDNRKLQLAIAKREVAHSRSELGKLFGKRKPENDKGREQAANVGTDQSKQQTNSITSGGAL